MFIGQFNHHLEEKGRLSVPKKFRSDLASGAILSQGLDGCLFLYPKATWESLISRLQALPLTKSDARGFIRNLSYGATEVEIDHIGRILVPEYLRQFAQIEDACIIAGAIDRIEIWSQSKFAAYTKEISSTVESIAEKLDLS